MTGSLRTTARNPIAITLMGVLVLVFLILGVGGGGKLPDAFRTVNADAVVSAGSHSLSTRDFKRVFDQQRTKLEQQAQQPLTVDILVKNGFDARILDGVAQDESLAEVLTRAGITPSADVIDAEIRKLPEAFDRVTGKFSETQFNQFLASQGLTPRQAQDLLADELAQRHFSAAWQAGFNVPRLFVALEAVSALEIRDVSYFLLDPRVVPQPAPPTDAELTAFIKANAAQLMTPEMRTLTLVRFSAQALTPSTTVDPAAVKKEFEFRKDSLSSPETRSLVEIPVKSATDAQSVAARLERGEDAAAIAKSLGVEPVTYVDKPQPAIADHKLAQAVFAMRAGETRGPIQGDLGLAVAKVIKVTPGHEATFESAKAKIEADLRAKAAKDRAYEQSQKFDDARQAGSSLTDAAAKAGAATITVGPVTAKGVGLDGKPNPLLTDAILKFAFAAPLKEEGDIQDAGSGEYYALRVDKIAPPALPSLADKRAELTGAWMRQHYFAAIRARAESLVGEINKGRSVDQAAAEVGAHAVHQQGMQRIQARQYQALGQDFLENAFGARAGAVFVSNAPGGIIIAKLDAVRPGDVNAMAHALEANRQRLASGYLRDVDAAVRQAALDAIKPTTNLDLARRAIGVDPTLLPKLTDKTTAKAK
jgi:peptidyl-prolyl cis-trans isomerase D